MAPDYPVPALDSLRAPVLVVTLPVALLGALPLKYYSSYRREKELRFLIVVPEVNLGLKMTCFRRRGVKKSPCGTLNPRGRLARTRVTGLTLATAWYGDAGRRV